MFHVRSRFVSSIACGVLAGSATVAAAQQTVIPHHQDVPPGPALSPSEAIAKMQVPEGFQVELVAAEPDLVNPVAMTFDERGRVWVTESLEYPRRSPGPGRDRVKILEDTDGDGRTDKVTNFAEGLNIPSGIAVGHGGVWVANAPDILFLQDTDGDGKADRREVVVTGFGRLDTHELPNSLTWGPDGWLYGLNGVFNPGRIEHQGKTHQFNAAMFRIHPRTRAFELFAEGTSNPWGIAFDDLGGAFISACVIDHLWHLAETGYYHRQAGAYPPHAWKIGSIVKHKHQKAAYCGIEWFDSDAYPPEYRNRLYMGNIHGNCLNVDVPERLGSTYFAKPAPDFLTANDAWFMPVAQKTGPDGCLYVLDWYDRYHCYQDANRDPAGIDRLKGRLYRIRYKDAPRAKPFDLQAQSDDRLVARLASPNVYFRRTAQRVLSERATPALRTQLEGLVFDDREPLRTRLHALFAIAGMDAPPEEFLLRLLKHDEPALRAWGVRIAGNARTDSAAVRARMTELAFDPSPDVLLQVAVASRKLPDCDASALLVAALAAGGNDPLLPHVVWQNLHPLLETDAERFVAALERIDVAKTPSLAEILPRAVDRLLVRKTFDARPIAALVRRLAIGPQADAESARRCLATLAQRAQSGELGKERGAALRAAVAPVLTEVFAGGSQHPSSLDAALLATSWGDPAGRDAVRATLTDLRNPADRRAAAAEALVAAKDAALIDAVAVVLADAERNPIALRGRLIATLGRLDDPRVAAVLLERHREMEPELRPQAIETLTQRAAWSRELLAAIGRGDVPATALDLNQVRRLLATKDAAVQEAVRKHWGTIRETRNPDRERIIGEMKQLVRSTPGDAIAGQATFRKACGQCHKIHGEGSDVGPDVTLNGRNSFDQLLSNVFDPSLVIGRAYQARTVVTTQGRLLTGLPVEETAERVVLKMQGGKLETIARADIEELKVSEVSMMPEQLERQLKPQELADLFAFLTLDKPPQDPTARRLPGVRQVTQRETTDAAQFAELIGEVAPGFSCKGSGEGGVALLPEHRGRSTAVRTHPVSRTEPCTLTGEFALPADRTSKLLLSVSHHEKGDWQLLVRVDGRELLKALVGPQTAPQGWAEHVVDLSSFAGKTVRIELVNQPTDWSWEFGYWGRAAVATETPTGR